MVDSIIGAICKSNCFQTCIERSGALLKTACVCTGIFCVGACKIMCNCINRKNCKNLVSCSISEIKCCDKIEKKCLLANRCYKTVRPFSHLCQSCCAAIIDKAIFLLRFFKFIVPSKCLMTVGNNPFDEVFPKQISTSKIDNISSSDKVEERENGVIYEVSKGENDLMVEDMNQIT